MSNFAIIQLVVLGNLLMFHFIKLLDEQNKNSCLLLRAYNVCLRWNNEFPHQYIRYKKIYLDQDNGSWSLNYYNGTEKKEAYKLICGNTGKWITKTVLLQDANFTRKLNHNGDLSIKYISGKNTIFNSIEVLRQ